MLRDGHLGWVRGIVMRLGRKKTNLYMYCIRSAEKRYKSSLR